MEHSEASRFLPRRHGDDISGHAHRQAIGYAGLILPLALIVVAEARPMQHLELQLWPPLGSISAYYYTGAVSIFAGLLVALSLLLLTYQGYENPAGGLDRWMARIGGFAALGVAFWPTRAPTEVLKPDWWQDWMSWAHYGSAAVLFTTFVVFALVLFRKTDPETRPDQKKMRRNRLYLACGAVMVGSMAWIGISGFLESSIFLPEAIALWAFALSWLIKGRAAYTFRQATAAVAGAVRSSNRGAEGVVKE